MMLPLLFDNCRAFQSTAISVLVGIGPGPYKYLFSQSTLLMPVEFAKVRVCQSMLVVVPVVSYKTRLFQSTAVDVVPGIAPRPINHLLLESMLSCTENDPVTPYEPDS